MVEESLCPIDVASASLHECLRQLSTAPNAALIEDAQKLIEFLRAQGKGTLSSGELNRIDIDLSITQNV